MEVLEEFKEASLRYYFSFDQFNYYYDYVLPGRALPWCMSLALVRAEHTYQRPPTEGPYLDHVLKHRSGPTFSVAG